ncbi:major facilitator superfamily transporter [Naviculisporaceae sp. PSN 640]
MYPPQLTCSLLHSTPNTICSVQHPPRNKMSSPNLQGGPPEELPETSSMDDKIAPAQAAANRAASSWAWETDQENPLNWPPGRKAWQVGMAASNAFVASLGTSIITAAHAQIMAEFSVSATQAILPLSLYVFALALGPVVGGPLSETVGRYPVFLLFTPIAGLFTIGAAQSTSFAALCILRFLAGFFFAPCLAISAGLLNEIFTKEDRGPPSTLFILTPFLGPGLAPAIGGFVCNRKGWRWALYTMSFFAAFAFVITLLFGRETFHPVLKRRLAKERGTPLTDSEEEAEPKSAMGKMHEFMTVALIRPVHMLFTEPIVGLMCLYSASQFATLFSFFAAVPFVFQGTYQFGVEATGLVFLSVVVGCIIGTFTIVFCEFALYRPKVARLPAGTTYPELRLYPAMIGSIGPPVGLFWFAWTARADVSWASPAVAIIVFSWGNICIFISTMQYMVDTYHGSVVASGASANSLARYGFAGAFPLFTIQMYTNLGIGWATSIFAIIALALMPVPWVFFKFGKQIRARSKYETATH